MAINAFYIFLLATVVGEFLVPFILKFFYKNYDWRKMAMSVLGCPESPVRHIYRLWLLWLGVVLTYTAFVYYEAAKPISPTLASIEFVEILAFAIGAGVLSGLFSVNEQKDSLTLSAKIHGVGAAIGFMLLLFFPLTNSILELKCGNTTVGFVKIGAFLLALTSFIFFVMSDKERFRNTFINNEGLWEQAALFFMYVPFVVDTTMELW